MKKIKEKRSGNEVKERAEVKLEMGHGACSRGRDPPMQTDGRIPTPSRHVATLDSGQLPLPSSFTCLDHIFLFLPFQPLSSLSFQSGGEMPPLDHGLNCLKTVVSSSIAIDFTVVDYCD